MVEISGPRKRSLNKCSCCPNSCSPSSPPSPLPSPSPLSTPEISSGDEEESGEKKRLGMLDLELINCPVCFEPFTHIIFQCYNGHLACPTCCTKLRNKCPSCTLPIGKIRCRAMEDIVESITVPCPNSKFGCSEIFSYKDQKTHEKKCLFTPCSCPHFDCDYRGDYKDLYHHFDKIHKDCNVSYGQCFCGTSVDICMHISDEICVLKAPEECLLFVVQCFSVSNGVCVDVRCVAPLLGVKLDKFSYQLSMKSSSSRYKFKFECEVVMKRIQEVNFETPEDGFMFVPKYLCVGDDPSLKMKLVIRKLQA